MTQLLGSFSVSSLGRRAFLRGAASAFDLRGDTRRQYRYAANEALADCQAIREDWEQVGGDLRSAIDAAAEARLTR